MAARSKAWVCDHSPAEIVGSNPTGGMDVCCVCCVVRGQPRSNLDFGPVVKSLGITVKKEVGKVVETSDVVRSQATREFRKRGQEPRSPK